MTDWNDSGEEDSFDPHIEDEVWDHATEGPCDLTVISDILWVATDMPYYQWSYGCDEPYSSKRTWLPDEDDVWDTYYIPGYEDQAGNPWPGLDSHFPWYHNDPGDNPPSEFADDRYNNVGVSYDHVNHILSFIQQDDDSDWDLQITNIDFSDLDNPVVTTTSLGSWIDWYSPFQEANVTFETGPMGSVRYCYPKSDGNPVLVAGSWYADMAVSLDNGANWTFRPDLGHNYIGSGVYSYCEPINYYSIAYGPPGSNTVAIVGKWTIWKSSDLGDTWDLSWLCYGVEDWNPQEPLLEPYENGLIYETYSIGCNRKADPDCIWITMGWRSTELPDEGICQRNTSANCAHDSWEDRTYTVVSTAFETNIFEDTVVYPNDWPQVDYRGELFIVRCIPTALKYFEGSGRWWAFCFRDNLTLCNPNDSNFLLFSDDDGKTWSNILCDHKNEENWKYMHPFFSPRAWPFSRVADGWTKCQEMNYSGFGAVCDIIEHPDDPDIVLTVGYHWLRSNETVDDPAGRGDGTVSFIAPDATEAEKSEYSQYAPGLRSLGNYRAAICVSRDGGMTWGDVSCVMPTWAYPYAQYETGEFYQNYYYTTNPGAYRLFAIRGAEQQEGSAGGHETGWNPGETDNVWTAE